MKNFSESANKPTPEQMLKLAQIVEPDKDWFVLAETFNEGDQIVYQYEHDIYRFDPENNPAQLMQVVFAIANKVDGWEIQGYSLIQHLAAKDVDWIIRQAIEVLL